MALEIEIKFPEADLAALRSALQALGAADGAPYLECNRVYDTPGRDLRAANTLLRLRTKTGPNLRAAVLTMKRPPRAEDTGGAGGAGSAPIPDDVKVWDEVQTVVADADAMHQVLTGLGYGVAFGYDKVREVWHLDGVHVCLDTVPFGPVVELEGDREAILAVADRLGLDRARASTATYHDLNRQWRAARGLPPSEDFTFDAAGLADARRAVFGNGDGGAGPSGPE
ncbi:class IV adenylate cyclase [Nitratidesulfovibrio sp. SRB-5]|uniref:class IV adenylate cyclase n=1 Tax=Nitratidesulfovibrio sp. SRB-5 TaxID=2872636 RepID=UPI00102600E8|nr:class IV adenylate cyclase [Nitratidesulfovibrio sp. SRB-5]MBZ2171848.1 class IV adenylate cyclase [Nitratidesulfovibrio sp. SRB-5]RXF77474.1 CYTH domain-containing protein [Desulfovibrio sp. DS-1]